MERHISALLRFARKETYDFQPVDLVGLVESVLDQFADGLEREEIQVEAVLPDALTLRGDEEKLRQVVSNLVQNALEAMVDTNGERRLTVHLIQDGNGTVSLRTQDSGPGISPEHLSQIFEPFFTLKGSGTGLGLAIVKKIVEAHKGRVEVASEEGKGTTFTVTLPVSLS